ncbi:hypothetical protein O6H91_13G051600 [Diphasiastrum complanatum]|uniref:Uncharacterized protein n=1 Tax=Diphasiastrum complanatum TaxID=34168 RepID=A0ACC2BUK8_DIPCM|nr:hypothetical protein O6H91_13G051600 [Diphasiastrum complanatum]
MDRMGTSRGRAQSSGEVYNILPVHDMLADHRAVQFPEVRAAVAALQSVGELRRPPNLRWRAGLDLLDWLCEFFGFQIDNVKNQREHLVLLLANAQMRLTPAPEPIDKLDSGVVSALRKKVLYNYTLWCKFLGHGSNLRVVEGKHAVVDERLELLYISLYFLIWGEAANLRFMPECLAFIFHNMAGELNRVLGDYTDELSGQPVQPFSGGENGFLLKVVTPIYETVKAEAEASHDGKAPHSAWRNYDDMNEYFWSERCFTQLQWPLQLGSNYLVKPVNVKGRLVNQKIGKTGFVEQRSFWNIYRSFDKLWIMYILVFQASMILTWKEGGPPWKELRDKDSVAKVLTIFITWAALRILQSLLDAWMQYNLISRETLLVGIRMILKFLVAIVWTIVFAVLYRMWDQRNRDGHWSHAANQRMIVYLETGLVFVAPELIALILFIIPWLRNFIENTNWRIFYLLTWWFQSRVFVGRGLRESLIDNIKYTIFWVVVLAVKFSFSYLLQIKPMIKPTKEVLAIRTIHYKWHEFFKHTNRFAVGVLWAPVVLIYFMDTQIWYSIFSSFVGALVGLFSHIGEIRNLEQLKLRFPFFASAIQFNLIPEDSMVNQQRIWGSWSIALKDLGHRLKLRYGFGTPYKKMESKQIEAGRFMNVWNQMLKSFREEDLISDREYELLEVPRSTWNISVLQWPSVLISNEILLALGQAKRWDGNDKALWRKICKNEYRRCAVIEFYESIKHILLRRIVKETSIELQIVAAIFDEIETAIQSGTFTERFNLSELPEIHSRVVALVNILCKRPTSSDLQKVVHALQNLYDVAVRDFMIYKSFRQNFQEGGLLFLEAIDLPDPEDGSFYSQLVRLQTTLETKEAMSRVPKNLEARRRISFFSNSLFMTMPRAPQVEKMLAFSVLTPYYSEDVLYAEKQLLVENEDGVSILFYLQKIYPDEWTNFLERMKKSGVKESDLWSTNEGLELRLWASFRGQTLARTVRGMMYYNRALQLLAFLDSASEVEVDGYRELLARTSTLEEATNGIATEQASFSGRSSSELLFKQEQDRATAHMKFTYVVACQIYGSQKAQNDPRAKDILYLLKRFEALRVAYVDELISGRDSKRVYSVLVKYDSVAQKEVEIYRIELPGPLKLGEGKPENQNHAIIFTRGDAVQTIDMNQDNYFEESLKMRNLLQEFTQHYGMRKPTILGVREHVFTGSVSSLAWFMSAQETSFVTLGQRVLANPLKVRMHYGHPDVFDRLWFITRGGLSKASRVINISEDIFAGFNCTLRRGNVTHHEYIQVGKGRDVGLNQIALFEAKVASGNGEQMLSRDVYRLGHRLDFFRMLSFYYTTVGFFVNNMIVVLTVYAFLWGRAYLALSGVEDTLVKTSSTLNNRAIAAALNQQFIVQMGLFTALPMIVENSIEHGFTTALWEFFTMQLQLASVFFTFSMGTRTHYFGRTILHGGAKYRATGRGFVVRHEKFAEIYRLFARSHFIKGIELIVLLIVYESYGSLARNTITYILLTLSSWFLALTWIMAPFIFNPSGFDWLKTVDDFDDFINWLFYKGGILLKGDQSWEAWWEEEQEHLRTTGLWGKVAEIILDLRFFFFQYGVVYQLDIASKNKSILVYLLSWIYIFVAAAIHKILSKAREKYASTEHLTYRAIQAFSMIFTVLVIILLVQFTKFSFLDLIASLLAFLPTGWGLIQIAQVIRRPFLEKTGTWPTVVAVARLYELGLGVFVMLPVAFLSWLPGFQGMQTRILFNQAFSRGLQISRLLVSKKPKHAL